MSNVKVAGGLSLILSVKSKSRN